MPQSLSNVLVHIIFSTKERHPFLADPDLRRATHKYLAEVSTQLHCPAVKVGGVEDHVHILARQARTITVADWVKELKRTSSLWIKEVPGGPKVFRWQSGYGAFSVGQSQSKAVCAYITGQEEHHRTVSYQDEFRSLLQSHGVNYDESHVWD
jgi:REP element-mobilizing transposase RayT